MASTNPDTLRIKIKSLQPDAFCQIAKKYGFSDFAIEIVFSKSYCTAFMLYSLVHSKRLINSFGYILVLIAIPLFIAAFSDEYLNRKWVLNLLLIENYTIKIIHCTSENNRSNFDITINALRGGSSSWCSRTGYPGCSEG